MDERQEISNGNRRHCAGLTLLTKTKIVYHAADCFLGRVTIHKLFQEKFI